MIRTEGRVGSDSVKWAKYAGKDIIPLWIADTDYRADEAVLSAIRQRLEHGVLGYGYQTEAFQQAVVQHCQAQYHWQVLPEWICPIPGVVPGINLARAVAAKQGRGHGITLSPTYPHLRNPAKVVSFQQSFAEVVDNGAEWAIDFHALHECVTPQTGLLLLCHPHNPIGKAYSEDELAQFAALAKAENLLVCSDEIHCDLLLNGERHRPFAMLDDDTLSRTITLMAASKTFNVAGLTCAFAIIPDEQIRTTFRQLAGGICGDVNVLGMVATIAAFRDGQRWHQEMLAQFSRHAELVYERINTMPYLRMKRNQATYLAWIDARTLPVPHAQYFFEKVGVGLADGEDYGWSGYLRLNFGCSTEMLTTALDRMEQAVRKL